MHVNKKVKPSMGERAQLDRYGRAEIPQRVWTQKGLYGLTKKRHTFLNLDILRSRKVDKISLLWSNFCNWHWERMELKPFELSSEHAKIY
ncbi:hypothetical protein TNIN_26021 [Trichonephila inaurata madagascariensis]|uniref:Uncharacterized protein n=1 Tax=Trichonephila inaurata madagascariensis TaxID=2747483 RepID=A0A8X6XKW6_9ARAC|nr:hypothetical protein TNIN_26021 [Trichonephila inaurata madagascariensis]